MLIPKQNTFGLTAFCLLLTVPVFGQNAYKERYGYIRGSIDFSEADAGLLDIDVVNLGVRAGYMFIPNLGAEVRVGTTIVPDKVPVGATISKVSTDYTAAVLARTQMTFDPGIVPYAALGYGSYKTTAENSGGGETSSTSSGVAGYLGLDFQFKNGIAIGAEIGNLTEGVTVFGLHAGFDF